MRIYFRHARTLKEPCVLVGGLGMGFTLRAIMNNATLKQIAAVKATVNVGNHIWT